MADWQTALNQLFSQGTWPFASDSIIGQIFHVNQEVIWFKDGSPTVMFAKDMSRLLLLLTIVGLSYMFILPPKNANLINPKIQYHEYRCTTFYDCRSGNGYHRYCLFLF